MKRVRRRRGPRRGDRTGARRCRRGGVRGVVCGSAGVRSGYRQGTGSAAQTGTGCRRPNAETVERAEKGRPAQAPGVMIDRANYFIMQGRCEDAIPILERLIAQYPQVSPPTRCSRIAISRAGGRRTRPRSSSGASRGIPETVCVRPGSRRAYMDIGRSEDAVAVWRRLL